MASMGLLTAIMLARWTCRLLQQQIRPDEPAFLADWRIKLHWDALAWPFEEFSAKYLEEAADTMANINEPLPDLRWPFFELPLNENVARVTWNGVTVRLYLGHDIWNDCLRMQIDAVWEGTCSKPTL